MVPLAPHTVASPLFLSPPFTVLEEQGQRMGRQDEFPQDASQEDASPQEGPRQDDLRVLTTPPDVHQEVGGAAEWLVMAGCSVSPERALRVSPPSAPLTCALTPALTPPALTPLAALERRKQGGVRQEEEDNERDVTSNGAGERYGNDGVRNFNCEGGAGGRRRGLKYGGWAYARKYLQPDVDVHEVGHDSAHVLSLTSSLSVTHDELSTRSLYSMAWCSLLQSVAVCCNLVQSYPVYCILYPLWRVCVFVFACLECV